jgi:hypothetical protein
MIDTTRTESKEWPKVICRNCGIGEVVYRLPWEQSMWCDDCAAELRLLEAQDRWLDRHPNQEKK